MIRFRGGVRLDCRRPVAGAVRRELARLGLPGPFVVLTACHPGGAPLEPAEARRRTAALARRIRRAGRRPVRADGGDPSGVHVEPGWAADLPASVARQLAAEDGQSAIFRFDGERMWIDPVLVDAEPIALPRPPAPPRAG